MMWNEISVTRRSMLLVSLGMCCGCRSVPMTDRKQMLLSTEGSEAQLGLTSYQNILKEQPESKNSHFKELVARVGHRIAKVSGREDFQWEFRTLASEQQNAFCLPGGKVAVYEGIMPVCQTEAGLAVVMSHEIGHALARHGGERMTQSMVVNGGKQAVALVTRNQDEKRQQLIAQAYGLGSQYGVLLPYSRKHELEADEIGLMLMSKAGYDPEEAPDFWTRFGASKSGSQPMEYASTHPSNERRASALAAKMTEAAELYAAAGDKIGKGEEIQLARATTGKTGDVIPVSGSSGQSPVQASGFNADEN
jgi:metalloendopeptidase OMA1, mitochondrial